MATAHKRSRRPGERAGLRLIRLWVLDTRSKRFAAECRRQSLLVRNGPAEKETLEFIERAGDWEDESAR
jgi:hypothetical protein